MIACMINISNLNFDNSIKYASSVFSIALLLLLGIAVALEIAVIQKFNGRYKSSEFK
jgi:hypothetical protein